MDDAIRLPGIGPVIGGQVRYREDGVLRRWRATPLPSWGYFAGRIIATVLLADAAGLILVLVGVAMAGLHLTAGAIGGLLVSVRFFRWDPHRPRHARAAAGAANHDRSG